jgi:hypothetical protein
MRKRLIIGAIAAVVIGVAAWLWPSPVGTILRLEAKYADAFYGRQWNENLRAKMETFFGYTPRRDARFQRDNKRLDACEKRFIKLGHFEERTFVLNQNPDSVMWSITTNWAGGIGVAPSRARAGMGINGGIMMAKAHKDRVEFVTLRTFDGYAIIVLAARHDMPAWEERIRLADMTNSSK